ncbi:MAG: GC-type dockerin domain-anchored protein [Planctomycetota bacterium]
MNLLATSSNCYLSFALAASMQVATAAGQLVYDNGVGGPAGVTTSLVADSSLPQAVADGVWFQIDQMVARIEWTGSYAGGDGTPPAADNFVVSIRSDASGTPGPIIATFAVGNAVSRTAVPPGVSVLSSVYEYAADISFTFLNSVDYWIQIDNDNGARDDDRWAWATGPQGTGDSAWFSSNQGANWFDSTFPGADFRFFGPSQDCPADTNNDGMVTPADFNAWVAAFNQQGPECDQNGDGLCDPSDFNAWVINFNNGC